MQFTSHIFIPLTLTGINAPYGFIHFTSLRFTSLKKLKRHRTLKNEIMQFIFVAETQTSQANISKHRGWQTGKKVTRIKANVRDKKYQNKPAAQNLPPH